MNDDSPEATIMHPPVQPDLIASRRTQILEAAAEVFASKGFHSTTIKDIARVAGVADGTIYNYFENKTALLLGMLDLMTERARQEAQPANLAGMDLRTFLTTYLQRPLTTFEANNFELFRVIVSEVMVNAALRDGFYKQVLKPTVGLAEQYLRQWAEQNGVPALRADLAVRLLSSLTLGLILQRVMGDQILERHWDELPGVMTELLIGGLAGEQP
jgi:AcrR family transcriptional regulator